MYLKIYVWLYVCMYVCMYIIWASSTHMCSRWLKMAILQTYNNILQYSWRYRKLLFTHPSSQWERETRGRNELGNIKVQIYIIFYVQLAHLLFVQVNERTNMEEEYLTTTVYLHKSLILPASLDNIPFKIFLLLVNFLELIKFVPRGITIVSYC